LNKFDSILKESGQINEFHKLDVDREWRIFMDKVKIATPEDTIPEMNHSKSKTVLIVNFVRAIAAILILVLAFVVTLRPDKDNRIQFQAGNEGKIIHLKDGTTIELAKNSYINYPINFENQNVRFVKLEGEATFDVRKSILPFIVRYDSIEVQVLGTKFNLRKVDGVVYIKNIEGSVKVSSIKDIKNYVVLKPNDLFQYTHGQFIDKNLFVDKDSVEVLEKMPIHQLKESARVEKEAKEPLSTYKLESVIKQYLGKQHKMSVKIDRHFKYDKDLKVKLNLGKPLKSVLESLQSQGLIGIQKGKCEDCYIITNPGEDQ
jgi:hypothetical protein